MKCLTISLILITMLISTPSIAENKPQECFDLDNSIANSINLYFEGQPTELCSVFEIEKIQFKGGEFTVESKILPVSEMLLERGVISKQRITPLWLTGDIEMSVYFTSGATKEILLKDLSKLDENCG